MKTERSLFFTNVNKCEEVEEAPDVGNGPETQNDLEEESAVASQGNAAGDGESEIGPGLDATGEVVEEVVGEVEVGEGREGSVEKGG